MRLSQPSDEGSRDELGLAPRAARRRGPTGRWRWRWRCRSRAGESVQGAFVTGHSFSRVLPSRYPASLAPDSGGARGRPAVRPREEPGRRGPGSAEPRKRPGALPPSAQVPASGSPFISPCPPTHTQLPPPSPRVSAESERRAPAAGRQTVRPLLLVLILNSGVDERAGWPLGATSHPWTNRPRPGRGREGWPGPCERPSGPRRCPETVLPRATVLVAWPGGRTVAAVLHGRARQASSSAKGGERSHPGCGGEGGEGLSLGPGRGAAAVHPARLSSQETRPRSWQQLSAFPIGPPPTSLLSPSRGPGQTGVPLPRPPLSSLCPVWPSQLPAAPLPLVLSR